MNSDEAPEGAKINASNVLRVFKKAVAILKEKRRQKAADAIASQALPSSTALKPPENLVSPGSPAAQVPKPGARDGFLPPGPMEDLSGTPLPRSAAPKSAGMLDPTEWESSG